MQALTIIVYQSDSRLAQSLAATLSLHYHSVHVARSLDEVWTAIPKHRADVAVLDVESSSMNEVQRLHRQFPGVSIVCTHRVADEEMWAAALNAGASDMCPALDAEGILLSAERNAMLDHVHA